VSEPEAKPDLKKQGDAVYAVVAFLLPFFPTVANQVFPGGKLQGKGDDFWFVYISTLPLSVALTLIGVMWVREWGDDDTTRAWITVAILVASAFVGWGFGSTQDLKFFEGVHGPPIVYLAALVGYILATYAILYGAALYVAAIIASGWATHWLDTKLPKDL
jgi:hypothetical protein